MSNERLIKNILLAAIAVILWSFIYIQYHGKKNQTNSAVASKTRISQQTHPHLQYLLGSLGTAGMYLRKSVEFNTYVNEKKSALAEIYFIENFLVNKTNEQGPVTTFYAIPADDLSIIKDAIINLQSCVTNGLQVEDDILTPQEKSSLHTHLQTALDKMVQVQQAEQQSQPQKSNP